MKQLAGVRTPGRNALAENLRRPDDAGTREGRPNRSTGRCRGTAAGTSRCGRSRHRKPISWGRPAEISRRRLVTMPPWAGRVPEVKIFSAASPRVTSAGSGKLLSGACRASSLRSRDHLGAASSPRQARTGKGPRHPTPGRRAPRYSGHAFLAEQADGGAGDGKYNGPGERPVRLVLIIAAPPPAWTGPSPRPAARCDSPSSRWRYRRASARHRAALWA
ncbi:MAG: hypothetical protein CM15mP74_33610 [Halieaceae bacterium]|nr:MAG: hypothetical protein CM15mP74_33610 [Halieaceae bacterium]